jgi:hypothetical protein
MVAWFCLQNAVKDKEKHDISLTASVKRCLIIHSIYICQLISKVMAMVFNATFNNISAISWRSVLLVEETGLSGENMKNKLIDNILYIK